MDGMQRFQHEINRLFEGRMGNSHAGFPPVNLWVQDQNLILEAELPGIDPAKVEIMVNGDTFTLKGDRPSDMVKNGEAYHRQERAYGPFARVLQLPYRVQADKVAATYKRGVLQVVLPRAEDERSRTIAVKSE